MSSKKFWILISICFALIFTEVYILCLPAKSANLKETNQYGERNINPFFTDDIMKTCTYYRDTKTGLFYAIFSCNRYDQFQIIPIPNEKTNYIKNYRSF